MLLRLILTAALAAVTLPAGASPLREAFEAAAAQNPELRTLEARRGAIEATAARYGDGAATQVLAAAFPSCPEGRSLTCVNIHRAAGRQGCFD